MENSKEIEIENGRYIIRAYQETDKDNVLALWDIAFQKPMPEGLWDWKYHGNPYGHRIMICTDEKNNIKALFGGIPYPINMKGRQFEMTHLMDNMSHPDYRRSGLFTRTVAQFVETFTGRGKSIFLYGFPGKLHFAIGEKYHQYTALHNLSYLRANVESVSNHKKHSVGRIVTTIDNLDNDRLWEKCVNDYPFSVIRDGAFFKWRFCDHPYKKYKMVNYYPEEEIEPTGYAIFSLRDGKASLVDILMPDLPVQIESFISGTAELLAENNVEIIDAWLPSNHFLTQSFRKSGFKDDMEPIGFIPTGRSFDDQLSIQWAMDNIFYTMADGDLF